MFHFFLSSPSLLLSLLFLFLPLPSSRKEPLFLSEWALEAPQQQSPTFSAPGISSMEAGFYQSSGVQGDGAGINAQGSSGARQKTLCPLAHHSPPAVRFSRSMAQGLRTPALEAILCILYVTGLFHFERKFSS